MGGSEHSRVEGLVRLAGLILNNISIYGVDHAVTRTVIDHCYKELVDVLDAEESLHVEVGEGTLHCNGESMAMSNPLASSFAGHLLERDIRRFSLLKGMSAEEFERLVRILDTDPQQLNDEGGFAQAVTTAKLPETVLRVPPARPSAGAPAISEPVFPGYYTSGKRKFVDFALGFWGLPSLVGVVIVVIGVLLEQANVDDLFPFVMGSLALGSAIVIPIVFFRNGRRLIAIGFLAAAVLVLVLPIILLGACFLLFASSGF